MNGKFSGQRYVSTAMLQKIISCFRPIRVLLLGVLIGGVVVGAFNSWRNQNGARSRAVMRDYGIWSEYVELLTMADEISKDREDIDIQNVKNSLKMRLRMAKYNAEQSERKSGVVLPLFWEVDSPIWDHHIPLIQRAITCLENDEYFDKGKEGAELHQLIKNPPPREEVSAVPSE